MPPGDAPRRTRHQSFRFRKAEELLEAARTLGCNLPFDPDVSPLVEPVVVGGLALPNRIAVQPMEGCDASEDGAPTELTRRRYRRFAQGGSGLIWFEATSVTPDGRANPRQLLLKRGTVGSFARLVEETRRAAAARFGGDYKPLLVLQLTHSGRYSRPRPGHVPRVACANPHLDPPGVQRPTWTDEELDGLVGTFVAAAALALEAGFDAVDIKACHGYLLHELLGAFSRASSRYGGSFENRSRFLLAAVEGVRRAGGGGRIAVRLNATDMVPHPFGFGMSEDGSGLMDLAEPRRLVRTLTAAGCNLLNVTAGIPAHLPHIGRPFDRAAGGGPPPDEHPMTGVMRLVEVAAALQQEAGVVPVVGTGYSWLRQFWPHVGAAVVRRGMAQIIGVGRGAIAYPEAAADLVERGALDPKKCCVACSYCTELMRSHRPSGCVVRDRHAYQPLRQLIGGAR